MFIVMSINNRMKYMILVMLIILLLGNVVCIIEILGLKEGKNIVVLVVVFIMFDNLIIKYDI